MVEDHSFIVPYRLQRAYVHYFFERVLRDAGSWFHKSHPLPLCGFKQRPCLTASSASQPLVRRVSLRDTSPWNRNSQPHLHLFINLFDLGFLVDCYLLPPLVDRFTVEVRCINIVKAGCLWTTLMRRYLRHGEYGALMSLWAWGMEPVLPDRDLAASTSDLQGWRKCRKMSGTFSAL
jgi:hypothetical protein